MLIKSAPSEKVKGSGLDSGPDLGLGLGLSLGLGLGLDSDSIPLPVPSVVIVGAHAVGFAKGFERARQEEASSLQEKAEIIQGLKQKS